MTPQQFIAQWGPGGPGYELNERQGAQAHFMDLCALLEDLDDEALYDRAKAADAGLHVPAEVAHAMLGGTHPVKAWCEHRGLTLDDLQY